MPSSEHIYHTLRQEILNLTLMPGCQIREDELARRFGVSRSPVRNAIARLSAEHLLRVEPHKGTFITEIDMDYVRQLIFLRVSVELRVLPLICEQQPAGLWEQMEENLHRQDMLLEHEVDAGQFLRLDNRFHEMYFEALRLNAVWKLLKQSHVHYTRFRMLDLQTSRVYRQVWEEHRQCLAWMRTGQAEPLCKLIVSHLQSPLERISALSSKTGEPEAEDFGKNISCKT